MFPYLLFNNTIRISTMSVGYNLMAAARYIRRWAEGLCHCVTFNMFCSNNYAV